MRPSAMQHFFGISANAFPAHLRWIGEGTRYDPQYHLLKLHKASFAAVDDMLACGFTGAARTTYMRAKSTELLAGVVHAMAREALETPSGVKLSSRDIHAVVAAREIMHDRLGETLSLADLAKRVGLNRNKLAVGFKRVFDVSVHGYWRELKLSMARDMLRANELSVTEVAWQLGYAETSSFTRAFTARFGISPRALRSSPAGAELALEHDASREIEGGTILAVHPKMIR
jgi:AraC-like DNA-binding protein